MKTERKKREYRMTERAAQVARNEQKVLEAMVTLWKEMPYREITLEKVAERSQVTVRTILRKYGSKEGLVKACIENDAAHIRRNRSKATEGSILESLQILLADYEAVGDAAIRTLAVEEEFPVIKQMLDSARAYHRGWCAAVFRPYLPPPSSPAYESRLLAFVTATEFYLWKLLRRDLQKSMEETQAVFQMMVEGLVQQFQD